MSYFIWRGDFSLLATQLTSSRTPDCSRSSLIQECYGCLTEIRAGITSTHMYFSEVAYKFHSPLCAAMDWPLAGRDRLSNRHSFQLFKTLHCYERSYFSFCHDSSGLVQLLTQITKPSLSSLAGMVISGTYH